MDAAFAPYQQLYPSKFQLFSPTATAAGATDSSQATADETDAYIRSLLTQLPSARVQSVLHQLQEHLNGIVQSTTATATQPKASAGDDGDENNKIAVLIYSFSEVN